MRIQAMCRCGLENYTLEDWLAHWKYGLILSKEQALQSWTDKESVRKRYKNIQRYIFLCKHPKIRAIYLFCMTEIRIKR